MSDAEQMLIARLAPTVHVHMLKHGGIASKIKGHCIAFPRAVQEPATILPRLPAEVDIIRLRRQGRDDTHKDFRVRRYRVHEALCWLKNNNPAYSDIVIDVARIHNLPEDGELLNFKTLSFLKQSVWMTKALLPSNWMLVKLVLLTTQQFLELFSLSQELMYKNKLKQP